MSERLEVAPIGRLEADARRHGFAGQRIDHLDVDPLRPCRQGLDRHGAEAPAGAIGRQPSGRNEFPSRRRSSRPPPSRGRRAHRWSSHRRSAAVPHPAIAGVTSLRALIGTGAGRSRNTWPRSTATDPTPASSSNRRVRRGSRASGDAVPRKAVMAATTTPASSVERRDRLEAQPGEVGRTVRDLDHVEPQGDVAGRARHRIGHAGLGRAPAARQDPEQTRMAGLGIPTGCRRRVRTTPVERCVDVMRHGGEGALPPPDDALVDLEPPPHDTLDAPSGRQLEAVPNQRLPDRRHPADRQVSRPAIDRVAPRVAELGEDDVGGRSRPSQVHDDLTVEQEPAARRSSAAGELERAARGRRAARPASRRMASR